MNVLHRTLVLLFTLLVLAPLCTKAQSVDNEMPALINSGDHLALAKRYETAKDSIDNNFIKLLCEAYINMAFNQPKKASEAYYELINNHQEELGLQNIFNLFDPYVQNLFYMGDYETATSLASSFLEQTKDIEGVNPKSRDYLSNLLSLGAFGDGFKPELFRPNLDSEVPLYKGDSLVEDALFIPVKIGDKETRFMIDTGADGYGTNTITERFAKEHNIQLLDDSISLNGLVATAYAKLGKLHSMQIGEITYRNVAFLIIPDDDVFGEHINAVLGSAFLRAVGETQIYPNENKIVFPKTETAMPASGSNVVFLNGQPYLETFVEGERMLLHFDTGAGISLNSAYYNKYKEKIEKTGRLRKEGGVGGFGGRKHMAQYYMPSMTFRVGNTSTTAKEVMILTESTNFSGEGASGSLGSDWVRLHNKVTINYNKMFVVVE